MKSGKWKQVVAGVMLVGLFSTFFGCGKKEKKLPDGLVPADISFPPRIMTPDPDFEIAPEYKEDYEQTLLLAEEINRESDFGKVAFMEIDETASTEGAKYDEIEYTANLRLSYMEYPYGSGVNRLRGIYFDARDREINGNIYGIRLGDSVEDAKRVVLEKGYELYERETEWNGAKERDEVRYEYRKYNICIVFHTVKDEVEIFNMFVDATDPSRPEDNRIY